MQKSNFQNAVSHFDIHWFMASMATGAMGIFSYLIGQHFHFTFLAYLAVELILLAFFIFILCFFLLLFRILISFQEIIRDIHDPMVTIFFPAISISASILSTAISNVIFPLRLFYFDQHLGFLLAFIFYGLGMVGGIVFLLMTSYIFAISQTIEITQANGAWLLPPVGLFVNIFAGNFLIAQFPHFIGYYLLIFHIFGLGVAFFSYFLMLSLVFHQLYCCPPPHREMAPSFAVPLAPPGVSVIALLSLEKALSHFPQLYSLQSDFLPFISVYVSFVIGYGCFWAFLVAFIMAYYIKRQSIPFTLGFWAFVFPIAAFGIAVFLTAQKPPFSFLYWIAVFLWSISLLLWVLIVYKILSPYLKNPFNNSL